MNPTEWLQDYRRRWNQDLHSWAWRRVIPFDQIGTLCQILDIPEDTRTLKQLSKHVEKSWPRIKEETDFENSRETTNTIWEAYKRDLFYNRFGLILFGMGGLVPLLMLYIVMSTFEGGVNPVIFPVAALWIAAQVFASELTKTRGMLEESVCRTNRLIRELKKTGMNSVMGKNYGLMLDSFGSELGGQVGTFSTYNRWVGTPSNNQLTAEIGRAAQTFLLVNVSGFAIIFFAILVTIFVRLL